MSGSARKKLVYISHLVSPHQVKFCYALQKYLDTEFWFYESAAKTRGTWWDVPLGPKCHVLNTIFGLQPGWFTAKYLATDVIARLNRLNPDIVMLGGFSVPSNYMAYRWAIKHKKKVLVFTERSRDKQGNLRRRNLFWRLIRILYRKLDAVLVSARDTVPQFRDVFGFGDKVLESRYPADIDAYFAHPIRVQKHAYSFIFANRLTAIYDPLLAIAVFSRIHERFPAARLRMNALGELRPDCQTRIQALGIAHAVEFLDGIQSWDALSDIYKTSDILMLPARFSNGNYTVIEAMASGMGIVISDRVMGVNHYIEHGVNGFVCQATVEDFVHGIMQYVENPGLFAQHAEINRKRAYPLSEAGTAEHLFHLFKANHLIE